MTAVRFVLPDGDTRDVEVIEGESLMQAATRNGVPGIEGECGGEMSCATCHVHIATPWSEQLRPRSAEELDLLEMAENVTDESRLGCQVRMTADLDGLVAAVATMGYV